MPDGASQSNNVQLSANAAKRIGEICKSEGNLQLMLRLAVLGGGCSGFQYKFDLDDKVNDDDKIFENSGTKLVIDEVSLDLLEGAVVDFKEDLGGSFFAVENPNAAANCGCGASFSI
ncbi:MAG: iron-sulfur cluster assembly accessory protein [Rhodospirillaceae bacterium TMED8]|nr:iron-sulfur cluster insertion protein ErpA [Magnetovibrio sp.]OUT51904.1 MAG: iron-sulfur cluster assembly accessory protein [Rhodospirillaceae bacterium TMED8]|tara:strand:- start:7266 stop:7616 length:351 start_codon:yes stop_codon:yes gene_type:complete